MKYHEREMCFSTYTGPAQSYNRSSIPIYYEEGPGLDHGQEKLKKRIMNDSTTYRKKWGFAKINNNLLFSES